MKQSENVHTETKGWIKPVGAPGESLSEYGFVLRF
jgi:hypothetical protein